MKYVTLGRICECTGFSDMCFPIYVPGFCPCTGIYGSEKNFVMFRAIWYHWYNLKSIKNTHGGVLLLVKLQALACNFTTSSTSPWLFFAFFIFYKWYQIAQRITNLHILCRVQLSILVSLRTKFFSVAFPSFCTWSATLAPLTSSSAFFVEATGDSVHLWYCNNTLIEH